MIPNKEVQGSDCLHTRMEVMASKIESICGHMENNYPEVIGAEAYYEMCACIRNVLNISAYHRVCSEHPKDCLECPLHVINILEQHPSERIVCMLDIFKAFLQTTEGTIQYIADEEIVV